MSELAQFIDSWDRSNQLHLRWLDLCTPETLELKPGKGKTVRSNFVHLIGVRRMWCEESLPKEAADIPKLDWKTATIDEIRSGLQISNRKMHVLLEKRYHSTTKSRWNFAMFYSYALTHEAHHRSQIETAFRIGGKEPDDSFLYGLWDWTKIEY